MLFKFKKTLYEEESMKYSGVIFACNNKLFIIGYVSSNIYNLVTFPEGESCRSRVTSDKISGHFNKGTWKREN